MSGKQQAGKYSWSEIAGSAYRAYAASTGNKNFRGDHMPAWADLPSPTRTAWEAAVRQADSITSNPNNPILPEARWAGWLPLR